MSVKKAEELFYKGYSCAQSVVGAFAPEVGLTEEEALAVSACFGAGICATRGICGALSGTLMITGLIEKWTIPEQKPVAYEKGKEIMDEFVKEFAHINCAELLEECGATYSEVPSERTEEYYASRPCLGIIKFCAALLENRLKNN